MREIKFRAWDGVGMHHANLVNICAGEKWEFRRLYLDSKVELMQFTGLLDKNGNEIYEGDVVVDCRGYRSDVFWDKYRWSVRDFYFSSFDNPDDAFSEGVFEVIGNIHQNPELLTCP